MSPYSLLAKKVTSLSDMYQWRITQSGTNQQNGRDVNSGISAFADVNCVNSGFAASSPWFPVSLSVFSWSCSPGDCPSRVPARYFWVHEMATARDWLWSSCTELYLSLSQNRSVWRKPIVARADSEWIGDGDGDREVTLGYLFSQVGREQRILLFSFRRSLNTCREIRHLDAGKVEIPQQTSVEVVDGVGKQKAYQKRRNITIKKWLPWELYSGGDSPLVGHWYSGLLGIAKTPAGASIYYNVSGKGSSPVFTTSKRLWTLYNLHIIHVFLLLFCH